jgi:desulfoferrodoxin-like iron-binding protein
MGTEVGQVFRCNICGNQVKVVEAGGGVLVCCGVPMKIAESAK